MAAAWRPPAMQIRSPTAAGSALDAKRRTSAAGRRLGPFARSSRHGNVRVVQRSLRVSGIGVVSAFGTTHAAFRDGLLEGRSGIAPLTRVRQQRLPDHAGGAGDRLRARDVGRADEAAEARSHRRLRARARTARARGRAANAGTGRRRSHRRRAGNLDGRRTVHAAVPRRLFRSGPASAPALLFDSTVGNSAASLAGMEYKLRGPNVTVSHKEASGLARHRLCGGTAPRRPRLRTSDRRRRRRFRDRSSRRTIASP